MWSKLISCVYKSVVQVLHRSQTFPVASSSALSLVLPCSARPASARRGAGRHLVPRAAAPVPPRTDRGDALSTDRDRTEDAKSSALAFGMLTVPGEACHP